MDFIFISVRGKLDMHGVHGCFLSGYVCCKVQGRRRLVLMSEDGAELMEDGQ